MRPKLYCKRFMHFTCVFRSMTVTDAVVTSAMTQYAPPLTRPTQPFVLSGSINE